MKAQNLEVDESMIARMRAQWGLDDAFLVRYLRWIENVVVRGDLGSSVNGRDNVDVLLETIPYTRDHRLSAP